MTDDRPGFPGSRRNGRLRRLEAWGFVLMKRRAAHGRSLDRRYRLQ
jgi:hypothetical protein